MDLVKIASAPTIVPLALLIVLVKIYSALFGAATLSNPATEVIIVIILCITLLMTWRYMLRDVDMDL